MSRTAALLLVACLAAGATAQAPRVSANGNKLTVSAQDLELSNGAGIVTSLSGMVVQLAQMSTQIAAVASTAAANSDRVGWLDGNATVNFTALQLQATATNVQVGSLAGQIDQLSNMAAGAASVSQLRTVESNLIQAIATNSTALLHRMANCISRGPTASFDPTSRQCTDVVHSTRVFTCTGGMQRFTVPTGVNTIRVQLWGGGGAGSAWNTGGAGAYVEGAYSTSPGAQLTLAVACSQPAGQYCNGACGRFYTGAFPGANTARIYAASGGGGYTGIFSGGTPMQQNAIAVAAGGGGGGGGPQRFGIQQGGAGGGPNGQDGTVAHNTNGDACDQGRGGTTAAGGARGCLSNGGRRGMTAGSALQGGVGDDGGGGGAGWFGGGGGSRAGNWLHGGGGGGSSYAGGLTSATFGGYSTGANYNLPSPSATTAAGYVAGVAQGGSNSAGGPGLAVLSYTSRVAV